MKKTFRLTALILALLMLVNISASATTDGITLDELDITTYTRMFQSASQAAQDSEDAETVDVDGEEPTYHWGYVSGNASFNDVPGLGAALGTVPANSLIKVFYEESGSYKIEYNGVIGYISGSYLTQCKCADASVTDPAVHVGTCIYPTHFMQLANEKTAADLYALWPGFSAGEQAFVLAYLMNADASKYAELDALLQPPVDLETALEQKYTEEVIDAWIAEAAPTEEMMQRALEATSLESVVVEGDMTANADLVYVRTGKTIASYVYNDALGYAEIIEPSCQLVVAYVQNGKIIPVDDAR